MTNKYTVATWIVLLAILPVSGLAAAGSQEAQIEERIVAGEVTEIRELDSEWTQLTVLTEEGEELFVEIPTEMARSFRIRAGDKFESSERLAVRPGERLRVLEFSIDR
jgi:hypothetical protein